MERLVYCFASCWSKHTLFLGIILYPMHSMYSLANTSDLKKMILLWSIIFSLLISNTISQSNASLSVPGTNVYSWLISNIFVYRWGRLICAVNISCLSTIYVVNYRLTVILTGIGPSLLMLWPINMQCLHYWCFLARIWQFYKIRFCTHIIFTILILGM